MVVTVESRLILERGYPGGRGGYLGHDQVAINIASRRRSPASNNQTPLSRSGMEIDILVERFASGILNTIEMSNLIRVALAFRSSPLHLSSCYLGCALDAPCCAPLSQHRRKESPTPLFVDCTERLSRFYRINSADFFFFFFYTNVSRWRDTRRKGRIVRRNFLLRFISDREFI